jgi:hypothetical protein
MSTRNVVLRVMRNQASMASRGLEAWKRYFGGPHAVMRMARGCKKAASSARRRLERALVDPRNYED